MQEAIRLNKIAQPQEDNCTSLHDTSQELAESIKSLLPHVDFSFFDAYVAIQAARGE